MSAMRPACTSWRTFEMAWITWSNAWKWNLSVKTFLSVCQNSEYHVAWVWAWLSVLTDWRKQWIHVIHRSLVKEQAKFTKSCPYYRLRSVISYSCKKMGFVVRDLWSKEVAKKGCIQLTLAELSAGWWQCLLIVPSQVSAQRHLPERPWTCNKWVRTEPRNWVRQFLAAKSMDAPCRLYMMHDMSFLSMIGGTARSNWTLQLRPLSRGAVSHELRCCISDTICTIASTPAES